MRCTLLALTLLLPLPAVAQDAPLALPADAPPADPAQPAPQPPPAAGDATSLRDALAAFPLLSPVRVVTTDGAVHRGLLAARAERDLHVVVDGHDRTIALDRITAVAPLDVVWPPASLALVDGKVHTSSGLVIRWKDAVPLLASRPASSRQLGAMRGMQGGGVALVATGGAVAVGAGLGTFLEALVEWSWKDLQAPWVALGGLGTTAVGIGLLAGSGAQRHRAVEAYATPLVLQGGGGGQLTVAF